MKNLLTICVTALLLQNVTASTSIAASPKAYLHSYNIPSSGLAIDGYCPVTYHTQGKAVKGDRTLAVQHKDLWYFPANTEAKRLFEASPEKYIPAYGGWCAFGMSIEDKFPVDPTNFKIVNGRLMLFLKNKNIDALTLWNKGDASELTSKANAHWKKVSN